MNLKVKSGAHNVLLLLSFGIAAFCLFYSVRFFAVGADFMIIARHLVCQQPLNNRCVAVFSIKEAGQTIKSIEIGGFLYDKYDLSLGNHIAKSQLSFEYTVNGNSKHWQYYRQFAMGIAAALMLFILWRQFT